MTSTPHAQAHLPRHRQTPALAWTAALLCAGAVATAAQAAAPAKIPPVAHGIEKCVPTVLAKYPGEVLQVLLKVEGKQPVWEIEVEQADGKLWDVECSGATGKLVETEQRYPSADDPAFKSKVKITEAQATSIVLAKHPGKVERVEYEVESDGAPTYEFDMTLADGTHARVEVDAVSGKLGELRAELIEIGRLSK